MRDIVSCFNEHSINVSNPSCSNYKSNANNCISPTQIQTQIPISSSQNAVASVYKITLSNQTQFLVKVTWSRTHSAQGLTISFADKNDTQNDPQNDTSSSIFKLNINSRLFRKKRGNKAFESLAAAKVDLFWDFTNAKFESNPEPVEGFFVIVAFDSEIGLILGDLADDSSAKKLRIKKCPETKTRLISRQEHCTAPNCTTMVYSTRAQFGDNGVTHDIIIKAQFAQHYQISPMCGGIEQHHPHGPVLSVSIDKKTVIRVKRLQWNFRGNQTIFVDGLLVDLLWDVHDWFFRSPWPANGGYAVFMFRTRSGLDSRLWLEEKLLAQSQSKEQEKAEFSLMIYACKTS